MKLTTRVVIATAGAILLMTGVVIVAARWVVLDRFSVLQDQRVENVGREAKTLVAELITDFRDLGLDWSDWDDLSRFLVDQNEDFRRSNLTSDSLKAAKWTELLIVDDSAGLIFGGRVAEHGTALLSPSKDLLDLVATRQLLGPDPLGALILVSGRPTLVSSLVIHLTDGTEAPMRGHFITARTIDADWVSRLGRFAHLPVSLHLCTAAEPCGALGASPTEHQAKTPIEDIGGTVIAELRLDVSDDLERAGYEMLSAILYVIAIGTLVLLVFGVSMLRRWVLHPLQEIVLSVRAMQSGQRRPISTVAPLELAELGNEFNRMAERIEDREASLRRVLDSTGDGLALVALDGKVVGDVSAPARTFFGEPDGRPVWDWIGQSVEERASIEEGLREIAEQLLPFEMFVDQLPATIVRDGRTIRLEYREVRQSDTLTGVVVVARDVTALLASEASASAAHEVQAAAQAVLRDRAGFVSFLASAEALVCAVEQSETDAHRYHALHSLKGAAMLWRLESLASALHGIETTIARAPGESAAAGAHVRSAWDAAHKRLVVSLGAHLDPDRVELSGAELRTFVEALAQSGVPSALLETMHEWRWQPVAAVLHRTAHHIEVLAERMGKTVSVTVEHDGARLPPNATDLVAEVVGHLGRNAVAHGVEMPETRADAGKLATASVVLRVERRGADVEVTVSDDGGGVAWDAVEARAVRMGLAHGDRNSLVEALFHDGISTAESVTLAAGRGVGLGAVRATARRRGGDVTLASNSKEGAVFSVVWRGLVGRVGD